MRDVVKLAYLFDMSGNFILADKLDKIARNNARVILAEQGVYNPVFQGVNLKDELTKLVRESSQMKDGKYVIDLQLLKQKIQSGVLRYFIYDVKFTEENINGSFNNITKTLSVNPNEDIYKTVQNFNSTFRHELSHGTSPIKARGDEAKKQLNITRENLIQQLRLSDQDTFKKIQDDFSKGKITIEEYRAAIEDLRNQYKIELDKIYDIKPNFDPNRNTRGRTPYFNDDEVLAQTEDFKNAFNKENLKEVFNRYYDGDVKKFQTEMRQFLASLPLIKKSWDQINSPAFSSTENLDKLINKYDGESIANTIKQLRTRNDPFYNDAILEYEKIAKLKETASILNKIPGYSFVDKIAEVFGFNIEGIMKNIKDPQWFEAIRRSISNDVIEIEQELGLLPIHKPLRSEQIALQNKKLTDNIFLDSNGKIVLRPEIVPEIPTSVAPANPAVPRPINAPVSPPAVEGYCHNPNCANFNMKDVDGGKYCEGCGEAMHSTPSDVNAKRTNTTNENTTNPKNKNKSNAPKKTNQPRSTQISELTSQISQSKIKSTPKSKSSLSAILPTIKKLFKQLSEILQKNLDKFNNSPVGKVVNFAMLVKDIYFIVTLTDKISQQIEAGEDVMIKDQYDLGLTIVSLLTDQQTQAALRVIFPPIIPVLSNPQFQAWLVSINIGANVLSGLVSATDYLGTLMNTTNKSEGATSGVLNTPGSLQALVMPVFDLRDKYGEVYNALIDVEKGIPVPQAISKHIMKDASGGLEPYRLSLFYKFRENKPRILQYQKSAEFKKLPAQNQLLYPSANSAYAISSYKKARDAQARARQEVYDRNFGPGSGGLSRNAQ